ncbi:pilus assembly protein [Solilutibacter pythonis]|nr:PilC/PilY family type IV pilus protein [Lysobacter pythonis]
MKIIGHRPLFKRFSERITIGFFAAACVLGAMPVHATTSFPQEPLLVGKGSIPPNILLIMDDSGSMSWPHMPDNQDKLSGNYYDRTYVINTLYYNPQKTYKPWRTAGTGLDDRLAEANFKAVASDSISVSARTVDLRGSPDSYFYVPKPGVVNPGWNAANYDTYRVGASNSSSSYQGGAVQKKGATTTVIVLNGLEDVRPWKYSACFAVDASSMEELTINTYGGSGDGDIYIFPNGNCSGSYVGVSKGWSNTETYTYVSPPPRVSFYIYSGISGASRINYAVSGRRSWQEVTPTGRTQKDELQNFANWFQYHRTRSKMSKAGASEAFGKLGKNYRVGLNTIWNNNFYQIPSTNNDGLFEGENRSNFYKRLHAVGAGGTTPLHGALQRAAWYFRTDSPWMDTSGEKLTCRQNYAILTTDGYWNEKRYAHTGYSSVGNADRSAGYPYADRYSDTLADVAYEYWKTDLRPDMVNNVPTSSANSANWQHMVTFGISIGLKGTLDPSGPVPSVWPDPTDKEDAERIDDLWHAAVNGRGQFVVASDTDKFAEALSSALKAIDSRNASGSNIASSSTSTETTTLTFSAAFTSSTWVGDLSASPFNAGLTGVSSSAKWKLSETFGPTGVNKDFVNRTVLTTSQAGKPVVFDTLMPDASLLRDAEETTTGTTTKTVVKVTEADNIPYLRGDSSKEQPIGSLRKRTYPLGDIVNSSPVYSADSDTVYVGANDGMLHAVDSSNGRILFSYVPKGLDFKSMASLSSPTYSHRYFVDGQMDVISKSDQGYNKNILVAALGRGGRGVFALDVTSPKTMAVSNVLWDQTFQTPKAPATDPDGDMGYVLGNVRIRKGNGGKTYALVPNGIDSPNGSAVLYVYELGSAGRITQTTKLKVTSTGTNGLMSLGMADLNGDGTVDTVYGGDLQGNIWRWDFSGANLPTSAVKLFTTLTGQPITGGIGVGRDSSGNISVGFGTGRFISDSDVPGATGYTVKNQSIYGIIDKGTAVSGRDDLQKRTIPYSGTGASGEPLRGFENYSPLPLGKMGWYIDLDDPERVISAPTIYGSAMFLTSVIPGKSAGGCESHAGSGFKNAIDLFTGTSPSTGSFFTLPGTVSDAKGRNGSIGSVGVVGGMPTEINVTSSLVTVGTGAGLGTSSTGINPLSGGVPSRVNWREVVPQ